MENNEVAPDKVVKQRLEEIAIHPWHKRIWGKLGEIDRLFIERFALEHFSKDRNAFEMKVNRVFMDQPEKPKRWKEILEVLTVYNSRRV